MEEVGVRGVVPLLADRPVEEVDVRGVVPLGADCPVEEGDVRRVIPRIQTARWRRLIFVA